MVMERYRAGQAFNLIRDKITLPDVTLRLHQYEWQVHSDLLTAESGFFKAALQGDFKVSDPPYEHVAELSKPGGYGQAGRNARRRCLGRCTLHPISVRVQL